MNTRATPLKFHFTFPRIISPIAIDVEDYFGSKTPYEALESGRTMIRAWAKNLPEKERPLYAQAFMISVMEEYWSGSFANSKKKRPLPYLFKKITIKKLDASVMAVAKAIGLAASKLSLIESSYLLGSIYTIVLPEATRTAGGIYYTPPALTERLIDLAGKNGIDWSKARVLDPACGGGAFLAPICLRMREALGKKAPMEIIKHIQFHLKGWEIDPFAGWISQVFVEVALKDLLLMADIKFEPIVTICNSLEIPMPEEGTYDLVIGNPPYGKIKLTESIRDRFEPSLFGHPNLYGIFTHLALELCRANGIVAYLTPTSFLSGEYFKRLRTFIRDNATPSEIDFVSVRKGVFEDVLQETMLTVYQKRVIVNESVKVNQIITLPFNKLKIENIGKFRLPKSRTLPWILPRTSDQKTAVIAMEKFPCRLADWGYQVSTGPLVWNRHKSQLTNLPGKNRYPVIWAESISFNGKFVWKAEKINHKSFFRFKQGDDWLVSRKPCILLQRTTAKEQEKRLIAAALPHNMVKRGVVIENHLNMIIATVPEPLVTSEVLSVFLNSMAVNQAFSTISGSVAISAYELESLPLPSPETLKPIIKLLSQNAGNPELERACKAIYNNRE